jgi:hypothetical protein
MEGLASKQIEIINFIKDYTKAQILFCPTFYSDDPILERIFGEKPINYLEELGENLPLNVEIIWTGPKIISPEISAEHLQRVESVLKRKPFIWDNFFANDGPKQCQFLKIKPLTGRDNQSLAASAGWSFNPMNQSHLSKLVYQASCQVLQEGQKANLALFDTLRKIVPKELAELLLKFGADLTLYGRVDLEKSIEESIAHKLSMVNSPLAMEIKDWFNGKFVVDNECLTD